jgi:hypothetical protein
MVSFSIALIEAVILATVAIGVSGFNQKMAV